MEPLWDALLVPLWNRALPLLVWLVGLTAVFVPLEILFAAHPPAPRGRQWAVNLAYYFLNSLIAATLVAMPLSVLTVTLHDLLPARWLAVVADWPLWLRLIAGLIVSETGYYWGHRLSHQIPWLWRFHAIHHSASSLDYLVNSRAHPLDMVFSRLCALTPLYALGLGTPVHLEGGLVPVVLSILATAWGFFVHANLNWRFGPLEWLVSTPAFHHWHHTRSGPHDRNFSSTLPGLDLLFGTLHLPAEFPTDYGISSSMPDSLIDQVLYPLAPELTTGQVAEPQLESTRLSDS
ncbi:MAG TPA: sterol desaturase family protein [Planctomycetaceae bacterium]|nr:sterol desaturase family protein [Planctomycetaceae bacterium]